MSRLEVLIALVTQSILPCQSSCALHMCNLIAVLQSCICLKITCIAAGVPLSTCSYGTDHREHSHIAYV
jgi:hypothetical protein